MKYRVKLYVKILLVILYTVGIGAVFLGHPEILDLSSGILWLSLILVLFFEPAKTQFYALGVAGVFLTGYLAELIGVNTGIIFGDYSYGNSMGIQIMDTPILIGGLWLSLTIGASSVARSITKSYGAQVFLAATIMLIFDIIMEPGATGYGFWSWSNDLIPLLNYITWWAVALLTNGIYLKLKTGKNGIAEFVLICQTLFFVGLWITL